MLFIGRHSRVTVTVTAGGCALQSKGHSRSTEQDTPYTDSRDKLTIMGDLNARVGRDHTVWQGVLGRHGVGNCNANERMLLELCSEQGLIITNSLFQQIAKFKTIWQHPRS